MLFEESGRLDQHSFLTQWGAMTAQHELNQPLGKMLLQEEMNTVSADFCFPLCAP